MPELNAFHDGWVRLVNRVSALGYASLSRHERVWFNVQCLIQAIDNGGLISYYYNDSADNLDDCQADLTTLRATGMVEVIQSVNGLFPGGVPADAETRNEAIGQWPEGGEIDSLLEHNEKKAASEVLEVRALLIAFLGEHGLGT